MGGESRPFLLLFQNREHIFGVAFGFNFGEDAGDFSLAVDQERGALDAHDLFSRTYSFL